MADIKIYKLNDVWMRVDANAGIIQEISDYFTFFPPNYMWNPKYKKILPDGSRLWDGKIRLMKNGGLLPAGLLVHLMKFCKDNRYKMDLDKDLIPDKFDENLFNKWIKSLSISNEKGFDIHPYQHQVFATKECIKYGRRTIVSPTSSGKSLIIYLLVRYYLDGLKEEDGKILIIVPTKALVRQIFGDFADYSRKDDSFNPKDLCHLIYEGATKNTDKPIVISTWQGIYKSSRNYFSQFSMIIGDECHHFKAEAIKGILDKAGNARYRFGLTGTLTADGSKCNKLIIQGGFGKAIRVATNREMMDKNISTDIDIEMIHIGYDEEDRHMVSHMSYQEEIDFITKHKERNRMIVNLAGQEKGNTLVLFHRIKHGEMLKKMADSLCPGKNIHIVHGANDVDEREELRKIFENRSDVLAFASMGVFSTGINIKNLHNVYLTSPFKSEIKVLQSIGRGLRKHKSKDRLRLVDIVDDCTLPNVKPNYSVNHAKERLKIYIKEEFNYKMRKIML